MEKDILKIQIAGSIADTVKKERERMGWTLYKLSQKTGITAGNLCRIESGMYCPRIDTVIRIFSALGLELVVVHQKSKDPNSSKKLC